MDDFQKSDGIQGIYQLDLSEHNASMPHLLPQRAEY
tara:strand:- start:260 stop:367 length:108 start_codon:yes stop_codon:yes gene_type:complete